MTDCLVVQPIDKAGLDILKGSGLTVHVPRTQDFAAMQPCLAVAHAVITRNHGLSAAEIAAAPNLKVIISHGAGTDAIDKAEAAARNIPVLSTPGANTNSVAEHTLALILACARQVPQAERALRAGDFSFRYRQQGFELSGKTLGLVGYGRIARKVASLARAFGMRVLAVSQHASEQGMARDQVEPANIEALVACSDIVSLHSAPGAQPRFDKAMISALKPGAVLINTARGALVDETALIAALQGGRLSGAALDVFEAEPLPPNSPLLDCPRLILTPHIGGAAQEALERTAVESARKVLEAMGLQQP